MAWTAPMTAIAGSVFTASQFNTFIRDNFNECPTSKASTPGSYFVTTATNQVQERFAGSDYVATSSSTTSTAGADLTTPVSVGPTVTVDTAVRAFVFLYCNMTNTAAAGTWMSYDVSGATTFTNSLSTSIQLSNIGGQRIGGVILHDNLTPGVNTFTAKYHVSSGTGTFSDRRLAVLPF